MIIRGSADNNQNLDNSSWQKLDSFQIPSTSHCAYAQATSFVLLPTAVDYVINSNGESVECRCLLDIGSQSDFMTQGLVQRLGLSTTPINVPVTGIGESLVNISQKCIVNLLSRLNYLQNSNFLSRLIEKIADIMPQQVIDTTLLNIPPSLQLPDRCFKRPLFFY